MRKAVFTLAVDGYAPEICALTFPLFENYACKIGASFIVIDGREYPEWPAACEKLQIGQLARALGTEWNMYFDADALVHPDCPDWTMHVGKETVLHHGVDLSTVRFESDHYFRRDGRYLSPGNWCTIASEWCLDLWEFPTDLTPEQAAARCHPTVIEAAARITASHLVDDFLLARNAAKYGLKLDTIPNLCQRLGVPPMYFWHVYAMTEADKLEKMHATLKAWRVE